MGIVDVIQFEGQSTDLVWKSPIEDFNTATQLIVDETHEAIVMVEGRTEVLGAGRHTLETQNYFGLNAIQRMATGGKTAFPCKVYFVNKVHALDMRWGTLSTLPVMDPELDIMLHLQLRGNLSFVVDNSKKFVEKFVGFVGNSYTATRGVSGPGQIFTVDQVVTQLRGIISTEVTDQVAKVVTRAKIGLFSINAHLKEISELLTYPLNKVFEDYGIKLVTFNIEVITTDNKDTDEFQAAKSAAAAKVILADSEAKARRLQGYTWSDEQKAAILKELAGNDGAAGSFMGGVLGIGASGPMSEPISGIIDGFFGNERQTSSVFSGDVNPPASSLTQSGGLGETPAGGPVANAPSNPLQFVNDQPPAFQQQFGFGLQEMPAAPASDTQIAPTTPLPVVKQDEPVSEQPTALMCPHCGHDVDPAWNACPFCAKPLGKPKCPHCGHDVDPAWNACPFCATLLHEPHK